MQLFNEAQRSPRLEAIVPREDLKTTFGNLTLVRYGVNRSLQNAAFPARRERLFAESNLDLNRASSIDQRGRDLFEWLECVGGDRAPIAHDLAFRAKGEASGGVLRRP